jgi:hypothetical protein
MTSYQSHTIQSQLMLQKRDRNALAYRVAYPPTTHARATELLMYTRTHRRT